MPDATYPNYSTQFLSAPINREMPIGSEIENNKKEEASHMAPKITPFTLDSSNELLFQIYKDVLEFRKAIEATKKEPKYNEAEFTKIDSLIDRINEIILVDISQELSNILI